MNKVSRIVTYLMLLAVASCATKETFLSNGVVGREIIASVLASNPEVDYKGAWKYAGSKQAKGEWVTDYYVPEGEGVEAWTRRFTFSNVRRSYSSPASPEAMMNALKESKVKQCPKVVWNIIQKSDADLLYEYHVADCDRNPVQHKIARILYAKANIWWITYTQKGPPMDEQERLRWIETLSELRIVVE
ncbi:MAG: hypothetical protein F9K13_12850 [Candidatus Methylomirabilis oxygeniifera]|uniref:Lipoprotein n=1 Tax=Methylomirabilis oxygeniifera TaxID=671143 RepID=D5MI38_METO1|nr:MAG: hypothetical protein F9K13_12850 [Candidatus Methylomirabilis oxyfera]CBE69331.1 exported protein of unknown function [Candidatus Methylomirabilis oxyfera]